jgi:hypothetical protein
MALPSSSDFNKYDGTKFNNTDWDQNVDKTVEILANGNYDLNVNQITAQTYANIPSEKFSTLTAGEDLDAGDVVRISGGQLLKADNTTEAGITDVVGINVQTVTSGNTAEIAYGFYDAFSALTVGETYYVGVSGGITSTLPATYQVELGVAVSTTRINLDIKSKYQTRDLEIKNSNPNINLKNTGTGSGQIQTVDFETGDGQFAKIEGITTGTGSGNLNIYTDSGSGLTERLRVNHRGLDIFGNIMNLGIGNSPFASTYKFAGVNDTWYTIGTDNSLRFAGHIYVSNLTNSASRRAAKIYRIFANNFFPFYQITQVENFGTSTHIELAFNSNQLQVRNRSGATEELYVTFILGGIENGLVIQ